MPSVDFFDFSIFAVSYRYLVKECPLCLRLKISSLSLWASPSLSLVAMTHTHTAPVTVLRGGGDGDGGDACSECSRNNTVVVTMLFVSYTTYVLLSSAKSYEELKKGKREIHRREITA